MADGTSAADRPARSARPTLHFGRIVVVGGGCYGGYYVRQLLRAHRSGAVSWQSLVVVDRDAGCAVSRLPATDRPPALDVVIQGWTEYFASYLGRAVEHPHDHGNDAIVPSPLMPHLMADWLVERARGRWPSRDVRVLPLGDPVAVPWQRSGPDGTHYVSFADWMCPINCVEPARCPETRAARDWSMPTAVSLYATDRRAGGAPVGEPLVLRCTHRAYGVGMIDVRDVVSAEALLTAKAAGGAASFLIGTVSHCHGALRRIEVAAGATVPGAGNEASLGRTDTV